VVCPIREGVIAIGACVVLQAQRRTRCIELSCGYRESCEEFAIELERVTAPSRRPNKKKSRKKSKKKRRGGRSPGRKPWIRKEESSMK
jgi:hypothetical protein